MYANSEGSGETVRIMHRLALAFAGDLCDKYHNLMISLVYFNFSMLLVCYLIILFFLESVNPRLAGLSYSEHQNKENPLKCQRRLRLKSPKMKWAMSWDYGTFRPL